jgi:hypothetical protein
MKSHIRLLERIYLLSLLCLSLFIVFTPYLIKSGISVFEEETVEVTTILFLFGVGYVVLILYRKEVAKNRQELVRSQQEKRNLEQQLAEAFKYIGSINVQVGQIKAVFADMDKFPESRKDFKYILHFLADRVLGTVNVDWVLFRIIDTQAMDTLSEHCQTRGEAVLLKHKIGNRDLICSKNLSELTIIASVQGNFNIETLCIMPKTNISQEQNIFVRAVVNQLEMLFVIFTSSHYKNSRLKSIDQTRQRSRNREVGPGRLTKGA